MNFKSIYILFHSALNVSHHYHLMSFCIINFCMSFSLLCLSPHYFLNPKPLHNIYITVLVYFWFVSFCTPIVFLDLENSYYFWTFRLSCFALFFWFCIHEIAISFWWLLKWISCSERSKVIWRCLDYKPHEGRDHVLPSIEGYICRGHDHNLHLRNSDWMNKCLWSNTLDRNINEIVVIAHHNKDF